MTFIYLDRSNDGRAQMITPQGDVKTLEHHLFTEPYEVDSGETLLALGRLTDAQYDVYLQYNHAE